MMICKSPTLCSDRPGALLAPSQSCGSLPRAPMVLGEPQICLSSHPSDPPLLTGTILCSQVFCHPLSGSCLERALGRVRL